METNATFQINDYMGEYNFLKHEKRLILLAIAASKGSLKNAHKLLCPTSKPYFTFDYLKQQVARHNIDVIEVREVVRKNRKFLDAKKQASIAHNKLVQENMRKFEKRYGFKLRSAE